MATITSISTNHVETGACTAEGLLSILDALKPDVVFLEANGQTYTEAKRLYFKRYGVMDRKLEIKAIQLYGLKNTFEYVPVLDVELGANWEAKFDSLNHSKVLLEMANGFNEYIMKYGIPFLNTKRAENMLRELRHAEDLVLGNNPITELAANALDTYECNMIDNIYNYARNASFENAVFLCGAAHRSSIWEKVQIRNKQEDLGIEWVLYEVEL